MHLTMTNFEREILELYFSKFKGIGFPRSKEIEVAKRENTGAGTFTYFSHNGRISAPDGMLHVGNYGQADVDDLKFGVCFFISIAAGKIEYLEIAVNGDEFWAGAGKNFVIYDPDTGLSGSQENT